MEGTVTLKDRVGLLERTFEKEGRLEFEGDADSECIKDVLEETEGDAEENGEVLLARDTDTDREGLDDTEGDKL